MAVAVHRRRIERYIRRRTPPTDPPLHVSRRRLYILPTASGALFSLLLIVMVLGATNYSNNLAFALTFWLGATALVTMHRTHRNLAGLGLIDVSVAAAFAGRTLHYRVTLASQARIARRSLLLSPMSQSPLSAAQVATRLTVAAATPQTIDLPVPARRRGYQRCPMLRIESRYPMGLFRAWTQLAPATSALVYPQPAGNTAFPAASGNKPGQTPDPARGGDEFVAHRRYRAGDSPRIIDWKASARSTELMVTEHAETRRPAHWFDYHALAGMELEARLSQLALWVVNAEALGQQYGLILPGRRLGPAQGPSHRHACLEALAVY